MHSSLSSGRQGGERRYQRIADEREKIQHPYSTASKKELRQAQVKELIKERRKVKSREEIGRLLKPLLSCVRDDTPTGPNVQMVNVCFKLN